MAYRKAKGYTNTLPFLWLEKQLQENGFNLTSVNERNDGVSVSDYTKCVEVSGYGAVNYLVRLYGRYGTGFVLCDYFGPAVENGEVVACRQIGKYKSVSGALNSLIDNIDEAIVSFTEQVKAVA